VEKSASSNLLFASRVRRIYAEFTKMVCNICKLRVPNLRFLTLNSDNPSQYSLVYAATGDGRDKWWHDNDYTNNSAAATAVWSICSKSILSRCIMRTVG